MSLKSEVVRAGLTTICITAGTLLYTEGGNLKNASVAADNELNDELSQVVNNIPGHPSRLEIKGARSALVDTRDRFGRVTYRNCENPEEIDTLLRQESCLVLARQKAFSKEVASRLDESDWYKRNENVTGNMSQASFMVNSGVGINLVASLVALFQIGSIGSRLRKKLS